MKPEYWTFLGTVAVLLFVGWLLRPGRSRRDSPAAPVGLAALSAEVEGFTSIEECFEALENLQSEETPEALELEAAIFDKALGLPATFSQALELYQWLPPSDSEYYALHRDLIGADKALKLAATFDEAKQVAGFTPDGSEQERSAVLRMLELADKAQAQLVLDKYGDKKPEYKRFAAERLAIFEERTGS